MNSFGTNKNISKNASILNNTGVSLFGTSTSRQKQADFKSRKKPVKNINEINFQQHLQRRFSRQAPI
jgi:hypothetical protein